MILATALLLQTGTATATDRRATRDVPSSTAYVSLVERHAADNGVPAGLVHKVIMRESRYVAHATNRGALGLMQIKHATARAMGYAGPASGLLDPDTNLRYAVRYLAGAWRAASGNASRALALYVRGYRTTPH